eukprot:IDg19316t1
MDSPLILSKASFILLRRPTSSVFTLALFEVFVATRIRPNERLTALLLFRYYGPNLPVDGKSSQTQP